MTPSPSQSAPGGPSPTEKWASDETGRALRQDPTGPGQQSPPGGTADDASNIADAIAAAAVAVPGVTRLHSGSFGEVATYLPGRRVLGVRTTDTITEVHVVCADDVALLPTADAVRNAVALLVSTPVDVYVEDLDYKDGP